MPSSTHIKLATSHVTGGAPAAAPPPEKPGTSDAVPTFTEASFLALAFFVAIGRLAEYGLLLETAEPRPSNIEHWPWYASELGYLNAIALARCPVLYLIEKYDVAAIFLSTQVDVTHVGALGRQTG